MNTDELQLRLHLEPLMEKASLLASQHQYSDAAELLEQILETARKSESVVDTRRALNHLGICYYEIGRLDDARECLEEAMEIARSQNDSEKEALSLHELSQVHWKLGDLQKAIGLCEQALKLELDSGKEGEVPLHTLSILYYENEQYEDAKRVLEIVKESCEARHDLDGLGKALNELGLVCFQIKDYIQSFNCFTESILLKKRTGDYRGVRVTMANLQRHLLLKPNIAFDPQIQSILRRLSEE